jgi:hypothetical protein
LNVPGNPAAWVLVCVVSALAMLFLPGDIGGLLLFIVLAAMFAAVIRAYQEASRLAAERRRGAAEETATSLDH